MSDTLEVVNRLLAATNAHDVDALVGCFAPDYVNETPAHPLRGFHGHEQVRSNWTAIFAKRCGAHTTASWPGASNASASATNGCTSPRVPRVMISAFIAKPFDGSTE